MCDSPKIPKWPFLFGDVLLLGAAVFVYAQSPFPLGLQAMLLIAGCIATGAVLAVAPFVLEFRATVKLAEAQGLETTVSQIKNLETVATQIASAAKSWESAQEQTDKVLKAAKEIADRMSVEVQGFSEFMTKVNDREKATMKLEIDKMRRAEADWLQVLVRTLDHVYALHQGAIRSGQPNVIQQIGNFQAACRDSARRVGLTPFVPDPAEEFNPERHQWFENEQQQVPPGAKILETVATGYTYRGTLLRPALVRLQNGSGSPSPAPAPASEPAQIPAAPAGS